MQLKKGATSLPLLQTQNVQQALLILDNVLRVHTINPPLPTSEGENNANANSDVKLYICFLITN